MTVGSFNKADSGSFSKWNGSWFADEPCQAVSAPSKVFVDEADEPEGSKGRAP